MATDVLPQMKSDCPKPPHTLQFVNIVCNLYGVRRGEGGWFEKQGVGRDYTCRQVTGRVGCWVTIYPCTCYMRLSPLVQSHINTQSSDPEHSPGRQRKNTKKQRRERETGRGRSQNTREHLLLTLIYMGKMRPGQ